MAGGLLILCSGGARDFPSPEPGCRQSSQGLTCRWPRDWLTWSLPPPPHLLTCLWRQSPPLGFGLMAFIQLTFIHLSMLVLNS